MKYLLWVLAPLAVLYLAYYVKVKASIDVNLFEGHTPQRLEEQTYGLIQCRWFPNPHHCKEALGTHAD